MKAKLNKSLDDQKGQIDVIQETIKMHKSGYADSLKELERISEEIHERRRSAAQQQRDTTDSPPSDAVRSAGVGAEFPSPSPAELRRIRTVIQRQKSILSTHESSSQKPLPITPPRSSSSSVSSSTTETHDDVTSQVLGGSLMVALTTNF